MTEYAWLSLLDKRPDPYPDDADYWLLRTQFADWLEEHDREDEAHAWRHVVRTERIPAECDDPGDWRYEYPSFVWFSGPCGYYTKAQERKQEDRATIPDGWLSPVWDKLNAVGALTAEHTKGTRKPPKFGEGGIVAVSARTHVAAELALVHALIVTGSHKAYSR